MNDEIFDRLKANDPASTQEPDLTTIKARVDAHTADNIVPFTKRSQYARGLRVAAAVGALALAGGVGFAGGNLNGNTAPESLVKTVAPDINRNSGANMGLQPNGGVGAASDSSAKLGGSYMGYGGSVVLDPSATVTNAAGTAWSYKYSNAGLDLKAFAQDLASVVGLKDVVVSLVDGSYQANDDKGAYNVYVGNDVQSWFNAYNNAGSPWNCEQGLATPAKDGSVNITAEMTAQCDKEWVTPSKADAIAAAKAAFVKLGLQGLKGATYTAYSYSNRSMTVSATPSIDGMEVSSQWSVEVSKDGVFSVNGVAANIVKADSYPTVGARDAALRSALRMWQAFGPQQVWSPDQNGVGVDGSTSVAPTTPMHNGKPMVSGYVSTVSVLGAERSLMQVNLAGGELMLMPAWNYTAQDGTVWQILAIADEFVDWSQQPYFGGPMAYDTLGSNVRSATEPTAAPMMK